MIDGILHRVRTGVPWRDPPKRFGPWKTMYERHRLWSAEGQFQAVLEKIRAPRTGPDRPRKKPSSLIADKAYSNSPCHTYLHRPGIRHTIPGEDRQPGRPPAKRLTWRTASGFDEERYKKRNTVERAINKLKQCQAVAARLAPYMIDGQVLVDGVDPAWQANGPFTGLSRAAKLLTGTTFWRGNRCPTCALCSVQMTEACRRARPSLTARTSGKRSTPR
ncbi:transposase [Streptomyces sp. HD1123-B1]|uniref:transposase n=1 Tax=Streptomyces huangiella TaxID=3228804 RepID=UPI003D7ED9BA